MNLELNVVRFNNEDVIATSCDFTDVYTVGTANHGTYDADVLYGASKPDDVVLEDYTHSNYYHLSQASMSLFPDNIKGEPDVRGDRHFKEQRVTTLHWDGSKFVVCKDPSAHKKLID